MENLLLVAALAAIGWLCYWLLKAEMTNGESAHEWPFGYMTDEEYRRRYGDKNPY